PRISLSSASSYWEIQWIPEFHVLRLPVRKARQRPVSTREAREGRRFERHRRINFMNALLAMQRASRIAEGRMQNAECRKNLTSRCAPPSSFILLHSAFLILPSFPSLLRIAGQRDIHEW